MLLRACHVKRWTIVKVTREQTVAEHQYRVWALSMSLYDHIMTTSHNSFERESVGRWALVHDAEEIWTGDLPSTTKLVLESLSPGITKKLRERVLTSNLPGLAAEVRGLENTFAAMVVKIAECVETLAYYRMHSYNSMERESIYEFLNDQLKRTLLKARETYKSTDWGKAEEWTREAMAYL